MTDSELDTVYTRLCKTLTQVGEQDASLFLARFVMLAITRLNDAGTALMLIDEAGEGMVEASGT